MTTPTCQNCRFPIKTKACKRGNCNHRAHCSCAVGQREQNRDPTIVGTTGSLDITKHAVERWWQRTESAQPPCQLEEAWEQAVPVGGKDISGSAKARLYPPEDLVIIAHGGAIRTAVPTTKHELTTQHLKQCDNCGLVWNPSDQSECNWCDGVAEKETRNQRSSPPKSTHQRQTSETISPHECPDCGTITYGGEDDDRCKVCRNQASSETTIEERNCSEEGCYRSTDSGSDYCTLHSFRDPSSSGLADQL